MNIKEIREEIDCLDNKILEYLNKRMQKSLIAGKVKMHEQKELVDKEREKEILEKIANNDNSLLTKDFCEKIYKIILQESLNLQTKNKKLIAFQGERGAYSELATEIWDSSLIPISCKSFEEVFQCIVNNHCDFGLLPIENTLGGVIGEVNKFLLAHPVKIIGAIDFCVHHCLLAAKDTNYRNIKEVYSHNQALAQCNNFLKRHFLKGIEFYDTAGAAKYVAEKKDNYMAAIASKKTAKLYNLEIIKENIEDSSFNITRFIIISKQEKYTDKSNKCSVVFSLKTSNKAGSLYNIVKKFAENKVNLTRIESFPRNDKLGHFAFFIDFEGNKEDENIKNIIEFLNEHSENFKFLGCYEEIHLKN